MSKSVPYLFEKPHWQIQPVKDYELFFKYLSELLPMNSILLLADGYLNEEMKQFELTYSNSSIIIPDVPEDFINAIKLDVSALVLQKLTEIAARCNIFEMAMYICGISQNRSILEWYDIPSDPIAVSLLIPERNIMQFAEKCHVDYRRKVGENV